jgi:hypothetical protein
LPARLRPDYLLWRLMLSLMAGLAEEEVAAVQADRFTRPEDFTVPEDFMVPEDFTVPEDFMEVFMAAVLEIFVAIAGIFTVITGSIMAAFLTPDSVFMGTRIGGIGVILTMLTTILTTIPTITRDHTTDTTPITAILTTELVMPALPVQKSYKQSWPGAVIIEVPLTECWARKAGMPFDHSRRATGFR